MQDHKVYNSKLHY